MTSGSWGVCRSVLYASCRFCQSVLLKRVDDDDDELKSLRTDRPIGPIFHKCVAYWYRTQNTRLT